MTFVFTAAHSGKQSQQAVTHNLAKSTSKKIRQVDRGLAISGQKARQNQMKPIIKSDKTVILTGQIGLCIYMYIVVQVS